MSAATALADPDPVAPQLRRGQHRDHALASWRRSRAVELKASGLTYQQVAQELGYANKGTVHRVVQQALEAREAEGVAFMRHVELDRLRELHAALWDQAMAGDVSAVMSLLRISDARCRLMGLYPARQSKDPRAHWDNCAGPPTVVVSSDDCRHEGCARHGSFGGTPVACSAAPIIATP